MKNLSRLTGAANRIENGPRKIDRRKLPQCVTDGCRKKSLPLKDGGHIEHCDLHRTEEEWLRYYRSWCCCDPPSAEDTLTWLSEGLEGI